MAWRFHSMEVCDIPLLQRAAILFLAEVVISSPEQILDLAVR